MDNAVAALQRLMEGNLRFLSGLRSLETLLTHTKRANVRAAADHLGHGSARLKNLIANAGLLVIGGEYSLKTGVVEFFDGLPERS